MVESRHVVTASPGSIRDKHAVCSCVLSDMIISEFFSDKAVGLPSFLSNILHFPYITILYILMSFQFNKTLSFSSLNIVKVEFHFEPRDFLNYYSKFFLGIY